MPRPRNSKKYRGSNIIRYGGRWLYWLNLEDTEGKYYGYYGMREISEFPECQVDFSVLQLRFRHCRTFEEVTVEQIWSCVTNKLDGHAKSEKPVDVDFYSIEMQRLMKIWPTINE